MPRRNRRPPHQPYQQQTASAPQKKRYASRSMALDAIKEIQKYNLDLELFTYQSPVDGGWYLTSTPPTS